MRLDGKRFIGPANCACPCQSGWYGRRVVLQPRDTLAAPVAEIAMFIWTTCAGIVQT
jgi:hypothetical protein